MQVTFCLKLSVIEESRPQSRRSGEKIQFIKKGAARTPKAQEQLKISKEGKEGRRKMKREPIAEVSLKKIFGKEENGQKFSPDR